MEYGECSHSPGADKILIPNMNQLRLTVHALMSPTYRQVVRRHSEQPTFRIQGRRKCGYPPKSRHRCFSQSQYFPILPYMNK
jgi:hypothetical protein